MAWDDHAADEIEAAKQRLAAKADSQRATTNEQIQSNHGYHPPTSDWVKLQHGIVRSRTTELSMYFNDQLPECDEKQEALKAMRLAMMWANAAIACHSNDE